MKYTSLILSLVTPCHVAPPLAPAKAWVHAGADQAGHLMCPVLRSQLGSSAAPRRTASAKVRTFGLAWTCVLAFCCAAAAAVAALFAVAAVFAAAASGAEAAKPDASFVVSVWFERPGRKMAIS